MIASGYLPYLFSENLCNGKLVLALQNAGIDVDVISRCDSGPSYSVNWTDPWLELKHNTFLVSYKVGNSFHRSLDVLTSGIKMNLTFQNGIRWTRRAYELANKLISENHYDAILTRSPDDLSHLVGYKLNKKFGIKWIANWNDPAAPIWPKPYTHNFNAIIQKTRMRFTEKMLRAADVVTFPSNSLREHFISHFPFLSDCNTAIIPHIALVQSAFPNVKPQINSGLRLLHSGNLSTERDPELTFKAIRELINEGFNDIYFDIMGNINNYTQQLILKYGLSENVKCIGSFSYMEALSKMQEYDILVLLEAILEKGIFFASKFTDYAQCRKPILAISPITGFAKETIDKYGGGICADNTDYIDIKAKIKQLYLAKQANSLTRDFTSDSLVNNFAPQTIIATYRSIIK